MRGRTAACVLAIVALAVAIVPRANAQCGAKQSTCAACHDGARAPYAAQAPWHADHAFASVCAVCHGGAPDAPAAADAHVGLVPPLGGGAAQCVSCHGAASTSLAERYAGRAAAPPPPPPPPPALRSHDNDVPAGILATLVAVLGLGWVGARERHALRRWRETWIRKERS